MSRLTNRLERDLREIAGGADPSPSAWESIVARLGEDGEAEDHALVLAPASNRPKYRAWITAAAAAFVVIAGAIAVLSRAGDDPSTAPVDQSPTTTFESPRHGYSVQYPDGAVVTPATTFLGDTGSEEEVSPGQRPPVNDGVDVVETASGAVFTGGSLEDPGGFPNDAWASIDDYIDDYVLDGGCGAPRSQQAEITIDGQPGKIAECSNEIVATVVAGGRIYGFTLLHGGGDARADFDAFADTIRLTPETAVDIPPLTDGPFVSPTNGFSIKYFDRGEGTLRPATALWDAGNQQIDDNQFDDGVDVVETGLAAIFMGSSAEIPDGVSIDEWVDEYVSPGDGCGGPRSQQEEITIDGQPGRVAECLGSTRIVATVVAGGRLYLFTLGHSRPDDARAFFDAWVATIDLTPETAALP
jgi:hypothetical protein